MAFEIGQTVGEYTIDGVLGQGGLGAVYRATHAISGRPDALKVMLPELTGTPELAERFRREIQLLAALNHPNIACLHHAFHAGGQLVMVMELVEGEDLRSLSRRSRMELGALLGYFDQVLLALEYAHRRGIVHRDIKPANIMVSSAGLVKVLDFGIAIAAQATPQTAELTAAGAIIGSPTHMSPEQIRGERATAQSDIYSLGVTLYESIAGQLPLQGASSFELMVAHLQTVPAPLRTLRPDIPASVSEAIARALEKDPARRFGSAAEFAGALHGVGAVGQTAMAKPTMSWQRPHTSESLTPPSSPHAQSLPLDAATKHLAAFIGPIAKIVVNRIAKQCTDADQLYALAAKQIDSETERGKFLRTRPR